MKTPYSDENIDRYCRQNYRVQVGKRPSVRSCSVNVRFDHVLPDKDQSARVAVMIPFCRAAQFALDHSYAHIAIFVSSTCSVAACIMVQEMQSGLEV